MYYWKLWEILVPTNVIIGNYWYTSALLHTSAHTPFSFFLHPMGSSSNPSICSVAELVEHTAWYAYQVVGSNPTLRSYFPCKGKKRVDFFIAHLPCVSASTQVIHVLRNTAIAPPGIANLTVHTVTGTCSYRSTAFQDNELYSNNCRQTHTPQLNNYIHTHIVLFPT